MAGSGRQRGTTRSSGPDGPARTAPPGAPHTDAWLARLFGLRDDTWLRHADPTSVWVRFAALPLIVRSVWSRRWIDRRSLLPVGASPVFTVVEPVLFPPARSTRNRASRGGAR